MSSFVRGSVLVWLLLLGCRGETGGLDDRDAADEDAPTSAAPPLAPESAPAPPPPVAVVPPPSIDWYTDDARGLEEARRRGAPRLVLFGASWSAGSRYVEEMFRSEEVRREATRFVAVTVDITDDEDPAVSAVVRKYAVEGLPLIIAFDSAGNEALRLPSLPDASEIASRLRSVR